MCRSRKLASALCPPGALQEGTPRTYRLQQKRHLETSWGCAFTGLTRGIDKRLDVGAPGSHHACAHCLAKRDLTHQRSAASTSTLPWECENLSCTRRPIIPAPPYSPDMQRRTHRDLKGEGGALRMLLMEDTTGRMSEARMELPGLVSTELAEREGRPAAERMLLCAGGAEDAPWPASRRRTWGAGPHSVQLQLR